MRNSPLRGSWMRYVAPCTFILLAGLAASSRLPAPASPQASPAIDPSKLPDIVGVHLGMSPDQAKAAFAKAYTSRIDALQLSWGPGGGSMKSVYTMRTQTPDYKSDMAVDFTLPPNPQVVWHVGRRAPQPNVNRSVILAALRQKYGKETVAISSDAGKPTTNDQEIYQMYWNMDEQGHVALSAPPTGPSYGCTVGWGTSGTQPTTPAKQGMPDFCAKSFVGLAVNLGFDPGSRDIIISTTTDMVDYPVLARSQAATDAFTKSRNQSIQQQQQEKSKEIKPAI
jgi:hypothetical protein